MIDLKPRLSEPSIRELLSYAVGYPTETKLDDMCKRYISASNALCMGYKVNGAIVGFIGISLSLPEQAVIEHISVDPDQRGQGIGSAMINELAKQFSLTKLTAETDNNAVGFYRKCGFEISSLGEKYPGVKRFRCDLNLNNRKTR